MLRSTRTVLHLSPLPHTTSRRSPRSRECQNDFRINYPGQNAAVLYVGFARLEFVQDICNIDYRSLLPSHCTRKIGQLSVPDHRGRATFLVKSVGAERTVQFQG